MASNSPWSVKGIAAEERELAKQAARRAGMPIGAWLTQQIRDATSRAAQPAAPPEQPTTQPAVPMTAPAAEEPPATNKYGLGAASWRRPPEGLGAGRAAAVATLPEPAVPARPAVPSVDPRRLRDIERRVEALAALEDQVAEVRSTERRLAALGNRIETLTERMDTLEARLTGRIGELAERLDQTQGDLQELQETPPQPVAPDGLMPSTAPIERAVMRLSERLQRVEELTLPEDRPRWRFWGRIFRR